MKMTEQFHAAQAEKKKFMVFEKKIEKTCNNSFFFIIFANSVD